MGIFKRLKHRVALEEYFRAYLTDRATRFWGQGQSRIISMRCRWVPRINNNFFESCCSFLGAGLAILEPKRFTLTSGYFIVV